MTERGAHTGVTSDHASEHEILRCLVGGDTVHGLGPGFAWEASSEFTNSAGQADARGVGSSASYAPYPV
jgi:hypothetical protein